MIGKRKMCSPGFYVEQMRFLFCMFFESLILTTVWIEARNSTDSYI